MYELRAFQDEDDGQISSQVLGLFPSYEAARDNAVPDHPDEWVWEADPGYWFHGGGNFPGQSFMITPGPDDPVPTS